jgi:type II secretory pathway component GspD/PulD (secretin)
VALLAQPKLLVKSNATATFHAGVTVPVIAYSDDENPSYLEETRSGTRELPAPGSYDWPAEDEYYQRRSRRAQPGKQDTVDLGVTLEIKPRIAPGGTIDLWLEPSVSEIAGWRPEHDVPIVMEREVSTTVRARHGDTIFIGGLFQESGISEMRGIPLMQRLPGVGRLFRSDEAERRHTEVVFILRIRVVE